MNSFLITQFPINMYIDKKKSKMNFLINNNKLNKIKAKSWKLIYCDVSIKVKTIVNFFLANGKMCYRYWIIERFKYTFNEELIFHYVDRSSKVAYLLAQMLLIFHLCHLHLLQLNLFKIKQNSTHCLMNYVYRFRKCFL